jgi:hypothetical protein
VTNHLPKAALPNLSVEEENLAAIPFAVLERRVGKRIGKIEIKGTKILPDGTEVRVVWQVQGNNELGLPTEQDLDVFVALGVLTFQNNFAKTITFAGRELAKILNIASVHGRFYQRLKLAMDRFIPLRFRAIAATEQSEQVKWCNVFQEASFTLDRTTGRCMGSITWTDKLIQSMDSGFFRVLDASRYMELDGITAKHLYRFLAVAFEKTDLIIIDARKLVTEHLGILKLPAYCSRLMQTLEPAFDQLIRIQVLGSYHVVSTKEWRIALHRHPSYVPERKALFLQTGAASLEWSRSLCQKSLEKAGFTSRTAAGYAEKAHTKLEFYALERTAHLLQAMKEEDVLPHVAMSFLRRALDLGLSDGAGRELLDWCEIAVEVCRHKKRSGQVLKNSAGLLIKILKDSETQSRLVSDDVVKSLKQRFRQREQALLHQQQEAEDRELILEYEQFRQRLAEKLFQQLPDTRKASLRQEKSLFTKDHDRLQHLPADIRSSEIDTLIIQEIAKKEAPSFERWRLRRKAQQVLLPFAELDDVTFEASF